MCDLLIYRGPHWMDEDDGGITKYESLQIFIDDYKNNSLSAKQKYLVIRYLVNIASDEEINKIVSLLLANGIILQPLEKRDDLLKKLDLAVKNWSNLNQARKDNIIAWADEVISRIPLSRAIDFKNSLTLQFQSRYKPGCLVQIDEDNTYTQAFSPNNKCSPMNISDRTKEQLLPYVKQYRIQVENIPALYRNNLIDQTMFSVTFSQIQSFLEGYQVG